MKKLRYCLIVAIFLNFIQTKMSKVLIEEVAF